MPGSLCQCGNFIPGQPFVRGRDCGGCWLRFHRSKPDQPKPYKVTISSPDESESPCSYRGEDLTTEKCVELNLIPVKRWAPCNHPNLPLGTQYVCPCKGCNKTCPGYSFSEEEDIDTRTRLVPTPVTPILESRMRWSYGVTTVKDRLDTLLPRTLKSLKAGGFTHPLLFIDACRPEDVPTWIKSEYRDRYATRFPRMMVVGNWMLGMWELYLREPHADYYAMFQDDLVCYRNLKAYLEHSKPPTNGYLNLFTNPTNESEKSKSLPSNKSGWYPAYQWGKGALALVFSNEMLRHLLKQDNVINKCRGDRKPLKNLDGMVIEAINPTHKKSSPLLEWVHSPSLVQHTGHLTSAGNYRRDKKGEVLPGCNYEDAPEWMGEDFDALSLLSEVVTNATT